MKTYLTSEIKKAVAGLQDEMVDALKALVQIPSLVGQEGPAQAFMVDQYERAGLKVHTFETDRQKVARHAAFVNSGFAFKGRPNVIATLPGDARKKSLILNGHIDVVSPEPLESWSFDPWEGCIKGGLLYGRGALDMKAGLIANLFALKALAAVGERPAGTLMLQSVIEEEAGGGGGTLACLMEGFTADAMLISEPFMVPVISHAGILYFRVKVTGKSAHAGQAHTGVNAIGKMMKIYEALFQLDAQRAAGVKFELYEKVDGRSCHLNIGSLRAGDWPSTVAGFAVMECRISFVPGETMADIQKTVEDTVRAAADQDPWLRRHPPAVEWYGWKTDPWYQDPGDPFIQTVLDGIAAVYERKPSVYGSPAGLDTRFSTHFHFPAISFGPDGSNEHGVDEYVDLATLPSVTSAIAVAALNWCGQARNAPY